LIHFYKRNHIKEKFIGREEERKENFFFALQKQI